MDKKLDISDELLQNLSMEELVELKVETEDLINRLDNIIDDCKDKLNS